MYEILGLIEKVVNHEGPARVMTLLGFEFNSTTGVLCIPDAKAGDKVVDSSDFRHGGQRRFCPLVDLVICTWETHVGFHRY